MRKVFELDLLGDKLDNKDASDLLILFLHCPLKFASVQIFKTSIEVKHKSSDANLYPTPANSKARIAAPPRVVGGGFLKQNFGNRPFARF